METDIDNKKNYMTMLREVLKKLFEYLHKIVPENKKSELIPFYSFNDSLLILGVVNLKREILDSEVDKYMNKYEIEDQYKQSINSYMEMIISIGEQIKNNLLK